MEKKKLAIVDDAEIFINLIKESLEDFFDIYPIIDSKIAFEEIKKIKPDIILMDINMPDINGIDLSNMLLKDKETKKIPIIILTSTEYNKTSENILRGQPNIYFFLSKLLPIETIKEKIDYILKQKI